MVANRRRRLASVGKEMLRDPKMDSVIAATCWRWASMAAREPERWVCRLVSWKGACWRHTVRRLYAMTDGQPVRLNRGHRLLRTRRWDDPIQATPTMYEEKPWQEHAQDQEGGRALEQPSIARVLRNNMAGVGMVTLGRGIMHATLEPQEAIE